MRAKKRKAIKRIIYYILGVILFLIVTPTVILWAFGFRIDSQNHKLSQTGILRVKTNEAGFDIFINDKKTFINKTTGTVKGLLPNDYLVTIKKDGFIPWSKTITIEPQKITRQDYIVLFPNNVNPDKYSNDVDKYKLTTDKANIIASNSQYNKLTRIDFQTKKSLSEVKLPDVEYFDPNNSGNKILVKQGLPENRYIITDFDKNGQINELSNEPAKINKIAWLPGNNQTLFLIYNNSLYQTNVSDQPPALILLKANISDFQISDNQLFYLQIDPSNPDKLSLWKSNFALGNPQELVTDIPTSSYQIIPSPDSQKVILKDNNKKVIYGIRNQKMEKLNNDIDDVVWNSDSQSFASNSDFEIWLSKFSVTGIDTMLVNRYSEKIDNLTWYPDEHHLLFTLDNKIDVVEEDGTNLTEVMSFQAQNQNVSLITSRQTITIFFLNKRGTDSVPGLYNLNLKNP